MISVTLILIALLLSVLGAVLFEISKNKEK
jgi:hypothetical protein